MYWIEAHEIQQAGEKEFKSVGEVGAANKWMPEDGGANGGRWLHEVE